MSNLLGIICDLCLAENKIFVIEEIENDVHPKALKGLLKLIERKSATNQFFISTHSNIVTKYLGALPDSKLFQVSMTYEDKVPKSSVRVVGNKPSERMAVLEELGYEFQDFNFWKGRLFLEEASAESVINKILIPFFVKDLIGKVRSFSSSGVDAMKIKFDDFNRLFVFTHQEEMYKNRAWIILDGGEKEKDILDKIKDIYISRGWNESCFMQFEQHDFESYYPEKFRTEFTQMNTLDKDKKRTAKKELLERVLKWATESPEEARIEFAVSAKEVIDKLKSISKELKSLS